MPRPEGVGDNGSDANGYGVVLGGDENVLKLVVVMVSFAACAFDVLPRKALPNLRS